MRRLIALLLASTTTLLLGCGGSSSPTEPGPPPPPSYGTPWLGVWAGTGAFDNISSHTTGTTGVTVTITGSGNTLNILMQTANSGVTWSFAVIATSTTSLYGGVSTTNAGPGYTATLSMTSNGPTVGGTLNAYYQGAQYYQNVFTVMKQ